MLMLSKNIVDFLLTFMTIRQRQYLNMTDSSTTFFSAVNLDLRVDFFTDVYLFDDEVIGVEPTTERIHVNELPVTILCPWYASTKTFRSNPSNRSSGGLS